MGDVAGGGAVDMDPGADGVCGVRCCVVRSRGRSLESSAGTIRRTSGHCYNLHVLLDAMS